MKQSINVSVTKSIATLSSSCSWLSLCFRGIFTTQLLHQQGKWINYVLSNFAAITIRLNRYVTYGQVMSREIRGSAKEAPISKNVHLLTIIDILNLLAMMLNLSPPMQRIPVKIEIRSSYRLIRKRQEAMNVVLKPLSPAALGLTVYRNNPEIAVTKAQLPHIVSKSWSYALKCNNKLDDQWRKCEMAMRRTFIYHTKL